MEALVTLAILVPIVSVGVLIAYWPTVRYWYSTFRRKHLHPREYESAVRFKEAMEALDRSRRERKESRRGS